MKAIRLHETGGPDVLRYEETTLPEPGPGEARVKIAASGVNFIDIYFRTGQYKGQLPMTLGQEAAGVVDAVGPGVTIVKPGDRVAYAPTQGGSYAEYAAVRAEKLVAVPEGVDLELAAAVMLQGMTAHYLSHSTYPVKEGDTALVHAAAGGVGRLLVQLAKRRGTRVIGTVGSDEKVAVAKESGADEVLVYTQVDFMQESRALTGGRGVDVVYDSVGKDTFEQSLGSLRPRGMMVLFGQSSGAVPPLNLQTLNAKGSLYVTRPTLGHYVANREEYLQRANDLFSLIATGELHVHVDREFPLSGASEAHRYLESRQATGKLLLLP